MRNTKSPSTAGLLRARIHPAFHVVLAYDEYLDGIRAKEFFDSLIFDHGDLFQFVCHLWKFDVLREPQLYEVAVKDALGADLIVFATRSRTKLPVQVRKWMDQWLALKQSDSCALILLLTRQPHQASEGDLGATLKQMAEGANVRVFCTQIAGASDDSNLTTHSTTPALENYEALRLPDLQPAKDYEWQLRRRGN